MRVPTIEELGRVYGNGAVGALPRFEALAGAFEERFGVPTDAVSYFSAPGRTEIIGNHTDHNGGKVLAASITMDSICVAVPATGSQVRIVSEGYDEPIVIALNHLDEVKPGPGSMTLVAGMLVALRQAGFTVGGLDAHVSSEVIPSAGVSSSASFEMLVGTVVSHLFNGGGIDCSTIARAGQFAENHFWLKASGLMDQMACGVGGTILLDFCDGARYQKVRFSLDDVGYDLVIVNTGRGHADLSAEYSAIPDEMHAVAHALGVEQLCQTSEDALLEALPHLRRELGCDRAILRSLHFFEECRRVDEAAAALGAGDEGRVLDLMRASGNSSWKWLQNTVVPGSAQDQSIPLVLALTELYLRRIGSGVCRVHGGGFAGVIMCALPKRETAGYVDFISSCVGRENVHPMGIRQAGAVRIC